MTSPLIIRGMGSDFLFAQPSFLSGLARLLDLGSTFDSYNESKTPEEADRRAISADWKVVGRDIQQAMNEFEIPTDSERPAQLVLSLGE